jgi:hypothetical protein
VSLVEKVTEAVSERFALEGEKVRDEFRAGLKETRDAVRVAGARYAPIYPNSLAASSPGRLAGWSVRETTGTTPAVVTVYAGRDPQADVLATVALAAGGSSNHSIGGAGVSFGDGAYVAVTGAVVGSLYFGAVD